jgi:hypothetical protein
VASPTLERAEERADCAIRRARAPIDPIIRMGISTRAANRTASVVVVHRRRLKAAAIEFSFWIIPHHRSETAVLYGRSRVPRSAADSSPKQFASGGLRFEEACEDCRFCDDRERLDRGVLRNGERRPSGRATHFFRQLGDRCRRQVRLRRQGAGFRHEWRLRRVSDRGRDGRDALTRRHVFAIALARSKRLLSLTPGVAAPTRTPSYGIASAPRSSADGSAPPLGAAAQRSPLAPRGRQGTTSSNSASSGRRRRSTRDGRREEGRQS